MMENILVFSISQREEIFLTKIALQNASKDVQNLKGLEG